MVLTCIYSHHRLTADSKALCEMISILYILHGICVTAVCITKDPLASHSIHCGHYGMTAVDVMRCTNYGIGGIIEFLVEQIDTCGMLKRKILSQREANGSSRTGRPADWDIYEERSNGLSQRHGTFLIFDRVVTKPPLRLWHGAPASIHTWSSGRKRAHTMGARSRRRI